VAQKGALMQFGETLEVIAVKAAESLRMLRKFFRHVPSLGFLTAAAIFFCEASTRKPLAQLVKPLSIERVKVRPAGYEHPIRFRRVGSDVAVVRQMLVSQEYRPVASLRDVRLIIDCGANIGLSAYYLLHCHPKARLVAIEPDAENCALCRQNLQPFGDRAIVLQAAVWSENTRLRIIPASREGGAWSLEVEPWAAGNVEGLTIPEILHRVNASGPIDLLKIDIEGAETELFRTAPSWLHITRNIAIELHGGVADATFSRALEGYRFERRHVREVTVIYGLHAPAI
jgi:FkbM family methyltransferase